jgi:hypothetical protein
VQVIGGKTPMVHINRKDGEWSLTGAKWEDIQPVGTNVDSSRGTTVNKLPGMTTTAVTTTSHIAAAAGGSIVGYGPFDIPKI